MAKPGNGDLPPVIGSYRILALLGEGGMGRVYRAEQAGLGRQVALKVLATEHCAPEACERFLREARAAAEISHPNVITCFDLGSEEGRPWMALELVEGGDAAHLAAGKGGRLDERDALRLVRDCAAGLEAIERAGLIHRDIKPANIFIAVDGVAKLADLGLARQIAVDSGLTVPGMPVGTPSYMSPEQAAGRADIDIRSDVWSLGATLFALLAGQPPFRGDSPVGTLLKVANEPPADLNALRSGLSRDTVALVERCLAKDRNRRPQSAAELFQAVDTVLTALERSLSEALGSGPVPAIAEPLQRPRPPAPAAAEPPAKVSTSRRRPGTPPKGVEVVDDRSTGRLDGAALRKLAERVHVAEDGLTAWLVLAPQASFPRELLEKVLEARGIVHGLDSMAVIEAGRRYREPRRLILARGDIPTPGMPGTDVFGAQLPAVVESVLLRVTDDRMAVWALTAPGRVADRGDVELAVKRLGLRFGIDRAAITRLWEGPPERSGRLRIACGRRPQDPVSAGFRLAEAMAEATLTGGEARNLAPVDPGTTLALWCEGEPGRGGMDVFGERIPVAKVPVLEPDDQAGEGVSLQRGSEGELILVATRAGYVQQRPDGVIRVIRAMEVDGDLDASRGRIESDEVIVVRGSVLPGAQISCANDVVILGDLHDAAIEAGGNLEVRGDIGPGQASLTVAETMLVEGRVMRQVVAGSLKISGSVEHCELVAAGDIQVNRVIGGSLCAGGSISVDQAGEPGGTSTRLHAGRRVAYEDQADIARLSERRLAAERERMVAELQQLERESQDLDRRHVRYLVSNWVRDDVIARSKQRLQEVEDKRRQLDAQQEQSRRELAQQRGLLRDMEDLGSDMGAMIEVRVSAHPGVEARLADADPFCITFQRAGFRLSRRGLGPPGGP